MGTNLWQSAGAGDHPPKKPSVFDFTTKLLLPGLTLAAYILGQIKGNPLRLQWTLLALTIFLVLLGFFYAPFNSKMRKWNERAKDIRATKNALPELRRLARSFAEFVDIRRQETLHWIVQNELCQRHGDLLSKLPIPRLEVWSGFSQFFLARAVRQTPTPSDLASALMEFYHLVSSYNDMCVALVFERLPQDLQAVLAPQVRGSLNLFQQRFVVFLKEYEDFVKGLGDARQTFRDLPYYFVRPKPL